jgi:Condensation domain
VSSLTSTRVSNGTHAGRAPGRAAAAAPVVIPRRGLDTAPLSFPQQQIWLHSQLAPDVPLYNEQVTIRYRGALEVTSLAQAFSDLLTRHEAWRTVFVTEAGALRQRILSPTITDVPLADLRHLAPDERERDAVRLATEDLLRPFDLGRGPLVRVRLAWLADEDSRL